MGRLAAHTSSQRKLFLQIASSGFVEIIILGLVLGCLLILTMVPIMITTVVFALSKGINSVILKPLVVKNQRGVEVPTPHEYPLSYRIR